MSVLIQLDRPHAHFTNIDFITGKVILRLNDNESISSVLVKLEGESKTRLGSDFANGYGQYDRFERGRPELEVHKVRTQRNADRAHNRTLSLGEMVLLFEAEFRLMDRWRRY